AIGVHNALGVHPLDVVRVGDLPDLPLATPDPDVLIWAEREGRILLTLDKTTMPGHLTDHLRAGRHSPGVFIIRSKATLSKIMDQLVLLAHAGNPQDYQDSIDQVP